MADQLPVNFAIPSENIIASYDYTDLADGEGKTTYYLYTAYNTATSAIVYKLGREQPHTLEGLDTKVTGPDLRADTGTNAEFNFTTGPFNVPKIAEGIAVFSCGVIGTGDGGKMIAKLYHYDGTTETQLGATYTGDVITTGTYRNLNILFTVPKTGFSIGDMIRLEVTLDPESSADTHGIDIGADPQNKAGDNINTATAGRTTVSTLIMPFRIDN